MVLGLVWPGCVPICVYMPPPGGLCAAGSTPGTHAAVVCLALPALSPSLQLPKEQGPEDLYAALNIIKQPSMIRVESDEVGAGPHWGADVIGWHARLFVFVVGHRHDPGGD